MSAATDQVKRLYPRYRKRLEADVLDFTRAFDAAGQAEATTGSSAGASADMVAVLDRWRSDVDSAIAGLNRTSRRASSRALALQTMQALAAAVASLADSVLLADTAQRIAASNEATAQLATYHSLAAQLDRRIP